MADINIYSTNAMLGVLAALQRPKLGILDMWFNTEQTEESEDIHFDIEVRKRKIAPFVAPTSQGKIVEREGFETATFRPAYVKPKTPLRPADALKRKIGEGLTPQFSAAQRRQASLAETLLDHADQVSRRLNLMAIEAIVDGKVTVSGEGYATKVVNFGRDNALSIVLSGSDRWSDPASTPLDDIEDAIELVHELEGAEITDIVMDPFATKLFRRNAQVEKVLDIRRAAGAPTAELGGLGMAGTPNGLKFVGNFGDYNVWSYSEYYVDPLTGETKPALPVGTVLDGSSAIEGLRAYGAIHDEDAGMQALPLFPKSWVEQDPSVRFVMTQSAPLIVPRRPNASFSMKVNG